MISLAEDKSYSLLLSLSLSLFFFKEEWEIALLWLLFIQTRRKIEKD